MTQQSQMEGESSELPSPWIITFASSLSLSVAKRSQTFPRWKFLRFLGGMTMAGPWLHYQFFPPYLVCPTSSSIELNWPPSRRHLGQRDLEGQVLPSTCLFPRQFLFLRLLQVVGRCSLSATIERLQEEKQLVWVKLYPPLGPLRKEDSEVVKFHSSAPSTGSFISPMRKKAFQRQPTTHELNVSKIYSRFKEWTEDEYIAHCFGTPLVNNTQLPSSLSTYNTMQERNPGSDGTRLPCS